MQQHRIVLDTYRNFATGLVKRTKIGIHGEYGAKQQHPACNIIHNIEEIKVQLKDCKHENLVPMFVQGQLIPEAAPPVTNETKFPVDTVHDYPGCSVDDRDRAIQQIEEVKQEYSLLFKEWEQDDLPPVRLDFDHRIELQPGSAIPHRNYYPIPVKMQSEATQLLSKFLNAGFLRSSKSPFAAPMMLIPKKTPGQWRIVFDFRALNAITVKDRHAIPRSQQLFDTLYGSRMYSTFDLQDGYYHMRTREEDIAKTAVTTPFGHYEWVVMPMGLCNAPATFQRFVNHAIAELVHQWSTLKVYLDDSLVHTADYASHVRSIRRFFELCQQHHIRLKSSEAYYCQTEVEFLGCTIQNGTLTPAQHLLEAIRIAQPPQSISQARSFLGLVGFYRQLIP
eukprot:scaffold1207_cov371-Pavlova_lutheri.AAC.5